MIIKCNSKWFEVTSEEKIKVLISNIDGVWETVIADRGDCSTCSMSDDCGLSGCYTHAKIDKHTLVKCITA